MKKSTTLLLLATIANCLFAQFDWEHTSGPEGGTSFGVFSNEEYAFYPGRYFLYRTSDGVSWEKINEGTLWPMSVNGSTLVAKKHAENAIWTEPSIWKISTDNGTNWSEMNDPPDVLNVSKMVICDHGIYANNISGNGVSRTQDGGATWEIILTPMQYSGRLWSFENRLYLSRWDKLWRTDANGENWEEMGPVLPASEYVNEVFVFQEHIIIYTTEGIWHSPDNGQAWTFQSMSIAPTYNLFTKVGTTVYTLVKPNILAKSEDFGASWTFLPADSRFRHFNGLANVNGFPIIATNDKGVAKWDENNQSFERINNGLQSTNTNGIESSDGHLWTVTGNGIAHYDLAEEEWHHIPDLLPQEWYFNAIGVEGDLVCVSENQGSYLLISEDSGGTWDTISLSFPSPNGTASNVKPEKIEIINDVIFLSSDIGRLARSADRGQTWETIELPFLYICDMLEHDGRLFNANRGDIFVSDDMGLTWETHAEMDDLCFSHLTQAGDFFMALATQGSNSEIYISDNLTDWQYASDGIPGFFQYCWPSLRVF